MGIAGKVFSGLIASFLLFALAVAVERTFFSGGPQASDDLRRPTSRAASGAVMAEEDLVMRNRSAVPFDPADGDSDRPAAERGPATPQNAGPPSVQAETASPRSSAIWQAASESPGRANPVPEPARALSFGSGGVAGAPAPVAPNTASSPSASPQSNSPVREVFFGDQGATACQPGERQFILSNLGALYVCLVFGGVSGTHVAQLTFVLPDGNVYQTMTLPFVTPDASQTVQTVVVRGQPYEVQQAGWGRPGESMVVAALPVAGTYISQYHLAGLWTVQVALDGKGVTQDNFDLFTQ
jgi:hypothetical protein